MDRQAPAMTRNMCELADAGDLRALLATLDQPAMASVGDGLHRLVASFADLRREVGDRG